MQTSDIGKQRRLKRVVIMALILSLLLGALYLSTYHSYVQAALWHREHGDYVQINGHKLPLPRTWREEFRDPDGALTLGSASGGFVDRSSVIKLLPMRPGTVFPSDSDALIAQQKFVSMTNGGPPNATIQPTNSRPASLATIKSGSVTFYCAIEDAPTNEVTHLCVAANFGYSVLCEGPLDTGKETEAILSGLDR
jgi:hypothetical protein